MPTSTVWRRRPSGSIPRASSPVRPSEDFIERLSPAPYEASPTLGSRVWRPKPGYRDNQYVEGLGLLGTSLPSESHGIVQPDHIYIDQNGGAHVGARVRSTHHDTKHTRDGRHTEARSNNRSIKSNRSKGHTRSGSTIDDLADAAIATSPRFAVATPNYTFPASPSALNSTRPATSYVNGYNHDDHSYDRPAKRIKSDKLHSAEWSPRNERPRTSHAVEYQSPRTEEAELLLGLRYAWGAQMSPSVSSAVAPSESMKENIKPPDDTSSEEKIATDLIENERDPPVVSPTPISSQLSIENSQSKELNKDAKKAEHFGAEENHNSVEEQNEVIAIPATEEPNEKTASADLDQSQQDVAPSEVVSAIEPIPNPPTRPVHKKPKKIQPEVQAEVCSSCLKLQREGSDEDSTTQWIGCEHCNKWFHAACVGLKDKLEARSVDKFSCKDCEVQYGKTTFLRKSSRARTAIDYAGLNQGVVKPSAESTMHHYIQPIKDGRIKYQADDFARIRPELMTAEFWGNMDGLKRPFVVPACWNPRFGAPAEKAGGNADTIDAEPAVEASHRYFNGEGEEIFKTPATADSNAVSEGLKQSSEEVIDCDQDYLDMIMPRGLTVRKVAELFGPEQPVPVIDVKSQETKGQFTLADWADYYELDGDKPIRNVISLEVSNSRLGRLIRRPRVVRDIDLEDDVWDNDTRSTSNKRPVQFYCLMSVADSYTDFHIDFGGSSVYYHILKGVKTFFFIPPEDRYLRKYEEWCNSDTQNETWLGDLCNGNVTRVDLHEGDTAFIPAGWIHSVWTPEDSLVIGGNFLTHLDYELQLKVANIEKTTRVPQKFRYPFFQKVMWYALLKYLDEDPVPEEVLRDFHEDEEYRFLRADPIWTEVGDMANDAEPGDVIFNARVYPKSELKGLPALRDYLYRTARIHADLPVSDINKKQIDAVKASIPKGHGDPMQLIKTFAVWCAWKLGNEAVPEWVHTDLNGLLPEIKEREKAKKSESFRVPPERVSARKAQQAQHVVTEDNSPVNPSAQSPEPDDITRKRNGSKSTGLRVACDACRKRRIKCRHKEGDDSPSSSSPAAIRPRTYSNVSVDIPKLASASPILTGFEQAPAVNGSVPDFSNTDLAQAALATLHSQSSDSTPLTSTVTQPGSAKKGRSKACEECRKSKRRCVHDEYGRVDPAKAAEPSKPRGSASSKRAARLSDEGSHKKVKVESEIDPMIVALSQPAISDSVIDPALMADGIGGHPFSNSHAHYYPIADDAELDNIDPNLSNGHVDDFMSNIVDENYNHEPGSATGNTMSVNGYEETIPSDNRMAPPVSAQVASLRQSPEHDISFSPITVDGNLPESIEKADVVMTDVGSSDPSSRHSPRPSKHKHRPLADGRSSPLHAPQETVQDERRASSEASGRSAETVLKRRRSSSNTSGTTHLAGAGLLKRQSPARPVSRGSTAGSDVGADEKLARELQAAENGLRRRTSMRA